MYERMLNRQVMPTMDEMRAYCGENAELFMSLNSWLSDTCGSTQEMTFPYGNSYGWGIAYRKRKKLLCNIFAEDQAFTVMMRLSDEQYKSVYDTLHEYTQNYIDERYPCGDGGWIQYRVMCKDNFEDIQKLLSIKSSHKEL